MKRLFLATPLLLLATLPVLAQERTIIGRAYDAPPFAGSYLICIGRGACSMATTQRCSVALGKNVQLPEGHAGYHVLATREETRPLAMLDDVTVERINGALEEYGRLWRPDWVSPRLDPEFVKKWNEKCGPPAIS